jgi:hypothetical protein
MMVVKSILAAIVSSKSLSDLKPSFSQTREISVKDGSVAAGAVELHANVS